MHYPDLSEYKPAMNHFLKPFTFKEVLTIGWLENGQPYTQGNVDDIIVLKLREMLASSKTNINRMRGIHRCDFCPSSGTDHELRVRHPHLPRTILLGMSELWLPTQTEIIYAAPTLIYHYITEHNYHPPDVYLDTVMAFDMDSDWDGDAVYLAMVAEYRRRINLDLGSVLEHLKMTNVPVQDRWRDSPENFVVLLTKRNTPDGGTKSGYHIMSFKPPHTIMSHIIEDGKLVEKIALEMIEAGVKVLDMETELHLLSLEFFTQGNNDD